MCSCLIMSKLFFLFRIRGWASSGVRPKPHPATELEFQVSVIEAGSVGSQLMHKWESVNLKTWKTPIRVLFSATQCKSKPFTLQHLPTHLKKKHRVNVTGFHYYPNYRKQLLTKCWRKKQKAREVSNELRVYSSFIPQRLINSSDSEIWKGSGKEVMLKQTVCRWSFKSHPFLFFCKHPLAE